MKLLLMLLISLAPYPVMALENNYPVSLKHVTSIGKWKQNKQSGYLRFVTHATGSEHVISKLHVQWITDHIDGEQNSEVIAEKEITELRGFEYTAPICNPADDCKSFLLNATESFGHFRSYRFKISSTTIGQYSLEKNAL